MGNFAFKKVRNAERKKGRFTEALAYDPLQQKDFQHFWFFELPKICTTAFCEQKQLLWILVVPQALRYIFQTGAALKQIRPFH